MPLTIGCLNLSGIETVLQALSMMYRKDNKLVKDL